MDYANSQESYQPFSHVFELGATGFRAWETAQDTMLFLNKVQQELVTQEKYVQTK